MRKFFTYKYNNSKREYFWKFAIAQAFFDGVTALTLLIAAIVLRALNFKTHELGVAETALLFFFLVIVFFVLIFVHLFMAKKICGDYDEHNITTWFAIIFGLPILCFAAIKSKKQLHQELQKPASEKMSEIKETPSTASAQVEASN